SRFLQVRVLSSLCKMLPSLREMLPSLREMLPFPCGLLPSFKGCYAFFLGQKFLFVKPIDSEGGVDYAQYFIIVKRCDGCGRPEYAVMCSGPIQRLADSDLEKWLKTETNIPFAHFVKKVHEGETFYFGTETKVVYLDTPLNKRQRTTVGDDQPVVATSSRNSSCFEISAENNQNENQFVVPRNIDPEQNCYISISFTLVQDVSLN
ncbi:16858_t:CDS:2, partial [Gigaspora rosea]